ncbi:hypothetical protein HC823_00620 [Candidatus Gracilibacteria bacterium]|nr:hypothetical protein [Candidatus Gracilibacteria bacterium]
MFKSNNQFIFLSSPEMGKEVVSQDETKETIQEIPTGGELVDTVASVLEQEDAENFSAEDIKEYFDLTSLEDRKNLIALDAIEGLLLMSA